MTVPGGCGRRRPWKYVRIVLGATATVYQRYVKNGESNAAVRFRCSVSLLSRVSPLAFIVSDDQPRRRGRTLLFFQKYFIPPFMIFYDYLHESIRMVHAFYLRFCIPSNGFQPRDTCTMPQIEIYRSFANDGSVFDGRDSLSAVVNLSIDSPRCVYAPPIVVGIPFR